MSDSATAAIPTDAEHSRAHIVAAIARIGITVSGIGILLLSPELHPHPALAIAGMALVLVSGATQIRSLHPTAARIEEIVAAVGGLLVNGLGGERVTIITLLWLAAVITGTLARARVDWPAATIFGIAMTLPIALVGAVHTSYLGLYVAAGALMLSGRAVMDELNGALARARHEATHDGLTGALTRSAFRAALDAVLAAAREGDRLYLVLLDIDRFSMINKLRGHASGDDLLQRVVRLMSELSGPDAATEVGRLGGDEFVMATRLAPRAFAHALLTSLAREDEGNGSIACSIGISHAPRDGRDSSSLLRAADVALRVAKQDASERVCTYRGDPLGVTSRSEATENLVRIIGGEGVQTVLQPIADAHTGEIHCFEALTRFGVGATSSPLHWLSLATELGMRDALEQTCLERALSLLPQLPTGTLLAVNVSPSVLPDSRTLAILQSVGDLSRLVIEVTEDALVREDDPSLAAAIAVLRHAGAKIAVDDVGAGYAGLRQLTAVHPDYLKLDRSLVSGIEDDPDRAALVSAMVDYGVRVGARVVGEGVETEHELAEMHRLGVHLLQGFLLARPAPPWPGLDREPQPRGHGAAQRRAA